MSVLWIAALGCLIGACSGGNEARSTDGGADVSAIADGAPDAPAGNDVRDAFLLPETWDLAAPDFNPVPTAVALPVGSTPPQRFLQGTDTLTGSGESSCSHQEPASGDGQRWCAFARPGPDKNLAELWIINLTRSAAGQVPACDGSSADCRRLTTTLWTSSAFNGPSHPWSHAFTGDTLLFYADAVSAPLEVHQGPVYAWRPGWAEPRPLTGSDGLMCFGHARHPVVHCVTTLVGDPMKPDSFELRAGSVAEPPPAILPSLGKVRPFRSNGLLSWQAEFTRDGKRFVLSDPEPGTDVEVLRVIDTAEIGRTPPKEAIRDVHGWTITNDDARLLFMREDAPEESGLYAADFPGGENLVKLGSTVGQYVLLGDAPSEMAVSLLSRTGVDRTTYQIARNSRVPAETLTVFSTRGFLEDVHTSPDIRYTGWLDSGFTGRIVRHTDGATCRLNSRTRSAVFEPLFLENAGLVFWNEDTTDDFDRRQAFYGSPDDCKVGQRFAEDIEYYLPIGDRGLIYTDEEDSMADTVSMKYAAVQRTADRWSLGTPVLVKRGIAAGGFSTIGKDPMLLLFLVRQGEAAGTYVFGPLPF